MELQQCSFIVACRAFFGLLPGENLQQFAAEIRALTQKDRVELIELFRSVGYDATRVG